MRMAVVIEADPVANDATGVLQCFEAMPMGTLLPQGSDDAFNHAILLRAMSSLPAISRIEMRSLCQRRIIPSRLFLGSS